MISNLNADAGLSDILLGRFGDDIYFLKPTLPPRTYNLFPPMNTIRTRHPGHFCALKRCRISQLVTWFNFNFQNEIKPDELQFQIHLGQLMVISGTVL